MSGLNAEITNIKNIYNLKSDFDSTVSQINKDITKNSDNHIA